VEAISAGVGRGTEFVVRIPRSSGAARRWDSGRQHGEAQPLRRRILVVDDNADAAEAFSVLLSIGGHDTRTAHDGETALATAADFRPDVVFLDIGMPTLDGHETARRMREQPWGKQMVIVALTGWGQVEDRRRSKEAGFNHHLVKPADPEAVSKLIASL
jgi:CheY-like chemotaxis protein